MTYRFRFGRMAVVTGAAVFAAIMLFPACRTATERAHSPDGGAAVYLVYCAACARVASPVSMALCIAAVGYAYDKALDSIDAAHGVCLLDCLND